MIQAHIFYFGTVQGVGFRYTTERYAAQLKLTGWVRNLSDGRVEIIVEGEKTLIEELCKKLEVHLAGYIKSKEIQFNEADGQFKDFRIVHSS